MDIAGATADNSDAHAGDDLEKPQASVVGKANPECSRIWR